MVLDSLLPPTEPDVKIWTGSSSRETSSVVELNYHYKLVVSSNRGQLEPSKHHTFIEYQCEIAVSYFCSVFQTVSKRRNVQSLSLNCFENL